MTVVNGKNAIRTPKAEIALGNVTVVNGKGC